MCHQMARMTVSPFKEGWLELAAEWTKLERQRRSALVHAEKRASGPLWTILGAL
jgi:hypothetical protein